MKKSYKAISMAFAILLFSPLQPLAAQQQKPKPAPKSSTPALSLFIAGNYFGPTFKEVSAVYRKIEENLSLPRGKDFKSPYVVLAGIRFTPVMGQSVQGEFGTSILKTMKDSSTNFFQMYNAGGSYIISLPLPLVSLYFGGGLGYIWLNTERTYTTRPGVARVNGTLGQLHGFMGIEFFDPSGVSFALEGNYMYATTLSPERAELDFTLKGITGGIRIGIPLILLD